MRSKVPATTYLDEETSAKVDAVARKMHSGRSHAIRHLVECALDGSKVGS